MTFLQALSSMRRLLQLMQLECFSPEIIDRLLKLRWWELDENILKAQPLSNLEEDLAYFESLPESARTDVKEKLLRL